MTYVLQLTDELINYGPEEPSRQDGAVGSR